MSLPTSAMHHVALTDADALAPTTEVQAPHGVRLCATDRCCLLYLGGATTVLAAHLAGWRGTMPQPLLALRVILTHGAVAGVAMAAPSLRVARWRALRFLGRAYPLLLMGALYACVGLINRQLGGARHFDPVVANWDERLFGGQPALELMQAAPSPLLSGLLHLAYLLYFPMLALGPLLLWRAGDRTGAERTLFATTLAFFACYAVFLLFPVLGPSYVWSLPQGAAADVWTARAARALFSNGDAWGSAFPSAHVATSMVAAWFTIRARPSLSWFFAPVVAAIGGAVVYSGIHYGSDAVAGLLLALSVITAVEAAWPVATAVGSEADRPGRALPDPAELARLTTP